ncbi:MAG: nicotinate-nucleotide adenylyltransferase [Armatimonadota bacterium]
MHIGIYGGSFNPIHHGHLILAQHTAEICGIDRMLLVPCHTPVHKQPQELASAELRLQMVRASVLGHPLLEACDVEIRRAGPSFTSDTLQELHRMYPDDRFSMLIGTDTLLQIAQWHQPEVILSLCKLLVLHRPGYRVDRPEQYLPKGSPAECVTMIEAPHLQISSSDIRQRIADGKSIRYLTPDAAVQIMDEHLIYRKTH